MRDQKAKVADILPGLLDGIRELNFGTTLLSIYILFDIGAAQGVFEFVNEFRLPFVLAALTVSYALYLVVTGQVDFKNSTTKKFILFCFYLIADSQLRTFSPESASANLTLFVQYFANYLIFVSCVKKTSQFVWLLDIFLLSVMHSSYHAIMQGGKLYDSIWLRDENHIGLIAAYAIPLALTMFMGYKLKIKKVFYALVLCLCTGAVTVAASRGAAIAMFFCVFLWILLSGHRLRNFLFLAMAVCLVFAFAPLKFFSEMATLKEGVQETTVSDRIYLWGIAARMFIDNPIVGVGPYNYARDFVKYDTGRYANSIARGETRVAHSTPLQFLSEQGILGGILLLLIQINMINNWKNVYKFRKRKSLVAQDGFNIISIIEISNAIALMQVAYWIGACFLTLTPYPFYWILIPFSESWHNISVKYFEDKYSCIP